MMNLERDIHPLTDFKKNTPDFLKQLAINGDPMVLTVNGKAKLVVQDAASYQALLELAEKAKIMEGIRRGLADMEAGGTMPLADFKKKMKKKHGSSI